MSVQAAPQTPAADGVFSPKVLLALIAAGVFATAAYLMLSAYEPDLRASRGGGAHAVSRSAVGYAGIVRLLRLMDEPVTISQSDAARTNYPGLMVAPQLSLLIECEEGRSLMAPHKALSAWLARMEARPSMVATTWERLEETARAA